MDMEELWSKTREVLRAEVNAVVYNSCLLYTSPSPRDS